MEQTGDEIKCVASEAVHHTVLLQDQHRCKRNAAETQKPDSTADKPRRRSAICQKLSHFCAKMIRKDAVMYKEAQTQDIKKHRTSSVKLQKISTRDFRDCRRTRDKNFAPHSYCDDTDITQGPTVFINMASLHTSHSFSSGSTLSEFTSTHRVVSRRMKVVEYGFVWNIVCWSMLQLWSLVHNTCGFLYASMLNTDYIQTVDGVIFLRYSWR